eukprot:801658-Pleurochrysis_carterae.AAC.2
MSHASPDVSQEKRGTVSVQYAPRHVSAAAVYLAARYLSEHHDKLYELPPHQGGKWYDAFHVRRPRLVCLSAIGLSARPCRHPFSSRSACISSGHTCLSALLVGLAQAP